MSWPPDVCGHCLGPKSGDHPRFCEACVAAHAEPPIAASPVSDRLLLVGFEHQCGAFTPMHGRTPGVPLVCSGCRFEVRQSEIEPLYQLRERS